jgi:methionyl-tRNA formyltransferase
VNSAYGLALLRAFDADVAVAVNFDQILRRDTLAVFPHGVINAHASKLPADRGVSPALWAFARGDNEIWVTLYRMDEGLDTGPIYIQFSVPVKSDDTAVTMYRRVCSEAGLQLADLLGEIEQRQAVPQLGPHSVPHSWPDRSFDHLLQRTRRRLIRLSDLWTREFRN